MRKPTLFRDIAAPGIRISCFSSFRAFHRGEFVRIEVAPLHRRRPFLRNAFSPQIRELHVAVVAPGMGDAFAAMPGASKDKQGHITVPVPDPKLETLAVLERTRPVRATVEVTEVDRMLVDELARAVDEGLDASSSQPELSGNLLSTLRASDAVVLAVPCRQGVDPVAWYQAAERALIVSDLEALEKQICKGGSTGPDAEIDVAKLGKTLANAKDKAVRRDADELVKEILEPGLSSLRDRLRAGGPARHARRGLEIVAPANSFTSLDSRFEQFALGWLNAVVTWKPLLLVADVPEVDAGTVGGTALSRRLTEFAHDQGVPCLTACVTLESETVALRDEHDFLAEYLQSFGLTTSEGSAGNSIEGGKLQRWYSQCPELTRRFPRLLNLQTFYTAGEKEARAWMCHRVRKDGSALPFKLFAPDVGADAQCAQPSKVGAKFAADEHGVPASLASRAIHTSFESRTKSVLVWKFDDLEALGPTESGPGAKDRAKAAGKMKKIQAQAVLEEGDVVEFVLN